MDFSSFSPQKRTKDGLYLDYVTILMTIMNMQDGKHV
jgi:hypothetical protein